MGPRPAGGSPPAEAGVGATGKGRLTLAGGLKYSSLRYQLAACTQACIQFGTLSLSMNAAWFLKATLLQAMLDSLMHVQSTCI